jgi:peptide/nickel transport system permease protein
VSFRWYALRRVGFALVALYLVVSVTFGFLALTPDPTVDEVARQAALEAQGLNASEREAAVQEAIREYREQRGLDDPIYVRYARWMVNVATFDWGDSYTFGVPVVAVLGGALVETLVYVVPAVLIAVVGGILAGVYGALNRGGLGDRLATGVGYLGFSLPNFWLGELLLLALSLYAGNTLLQGTDVPPGPLTQVVLPAAVLGTSLLAGQLRYARAESLEYVGSEFVKLVRAKGAGQRRIGMHVLRNAAVPLMSLFVADLLAVLVLNVYVIEAVFGIQGFGSVSLQAIYNRDLPVVIGSAMVVAAVGVGGNLLQDLLSVVVDPRVSEE